MTAKKKTAKKKTAAPKRPAKSKVRGTATAAAILGFDVGKKVKNNKSSGPVRINPKWRKYYERLLDLRDRLQEQMEGLAKESTEQVQGYSMHMADTGTDNFDRDFALSLLSSDQDAMYEIEEAIRRIEKNTYGVCELTGKPIPKARLDAIPWARFTVEAQAQLEREGAVRQRRLSPLGKVDSNATLEVEAEEEAVEEKAVKEKE